MIVENAIKVYPRRAGGEMEVNFPGEESWAGKLAAYSGYEIRASGNSQGGAAAVRLSERGLENDVDLTKIIGTLTLLLVPGLGQVDRRELHNVSTAEALSLTEKLSFLKWLHEVGALNPTWDEGTYLTLGVKVAS